MNTTKTMRLPPRRELTPTKRKERDDFEAPKPAKLLKPTATQSQAAGSEKAEAELNPSNQLLAGYLAHEFLTKGTLFGQPFDPARSQAVPPAADSRKVVKPRKREEAEPRRGESEEEEKKKKQDKDKYQRYVEVAGLLKTDGTHIAGIVNPTQLARLLHM